MEVVSAERKKCLLDVIKSRCIFKSITTLLITVQSVEETINIIDVTRRQFTTVL